MLRAIHNSRGTLCHGKHIDPDATICVVPACQPTVVLNKAGSEIRFNGRVI